MNRFWCRLQRVHPFAGMAGVFFVALLVRLVVFYEITGDPQVNNIKGDGLAYLRWAEAIARKGWLGGDVFYQDPLYPYLVALVQTALGKSLDLLRTLQIVLGASGCALLAYAAGRLWNHGVALVAGLLLAIYPSAISADLQIDKTVLDSFLMAALLFCVSRIFIKREAIWWFITGAICAVTSLNRANALIFVGVVALFTALAHGGRRKRIAALLGGFACIVLPVAARNSILDHALIFTTSQFGPNFYIGNSGDGVYQPLRAGRTDAAFERIDATELAEQETGKVLSSAGVSHFWTLKALRLIVDDPLGWMKLLARKEAMVFADSEIADSDVFDRHMVFSRSLKGLSHIWSFGILLPLALAGIWISLPGRKEVRLVALMALTFGCSIGLFFIFARYRMMLVTMLIPFAASAIVRIPKLLYVRQYRSVVGSIFAFIFGIIATVAGDACIPDRIRGTNPYNRGNIYASIGKQDMAIGEYLGAIRANPRLELAYLNLSLQLSNRGDFVEAESAARKAIELNPTDPSAYVNLGLAQVMANAVDAAIRSFHQALELDPMNRIARFDLAVAYLKQGQMDLAEPMLKEIAATQPTDEWANRASNLLEHARKR